MNPIRCPETCPDRGTCYACLYAREALIAKCPTAVLARLAEVEAECARLCQACEEANKAADERWTKALEHADWDGGVFHYEGRIYPWPRGFVPDCPATWEAKIVEERKRIGAVLHDWHYTGGSIPQCIYMLEQGKALR